MKKIEQIRAAVCKNRGGLKDATESQILIIWDSLLPDTQKQYLDSIKERGDSDAVSHTTKRNVRGGS